METTPAPAAADILLELPEGLPATEKVRPKRKGRPPGAKNKAPRVDKGKPRSTGTIPADASPDQPADKPADPKPRDERPGALPEAKETPASKKRWAWLLRQR